MSLLSLKTELRQELKLTPQLLQSMEVLQMNSQELLDYLGRLSEENPTLELSDSADLRSAYESLRQRASWLDAGTFGSSFAHEEDGPPEPGAVDRALESSARSSATSWSVSGCQSPCWPCANIWRSWWMRTVIWRRRIWTV